jgi:hypothetical protein
LAEPADEPADAAASSKPAAAAQPTPATASDPKPAAATAGAQKSAADPTAADEGKSSIDKKVAEAKKAYMVVQKDGQTQYCRKEPQIGSRLPKYLCLTEAQLIDQVRTNEDFQDRMRLPKPCTSGACSGS